LLDQLWQDCALEACRLKLVAFFSLEQF